MTISSKDLAIKLQEKSNVNIKKVTDNELNSVKNISKSFQKLIYEIGELNVSKIEIEKLLKEKILELDILREQEKKLGGELESKYGQGKLNLDTGEYQNI